MPLIDRSYFIGALNIANTNGVEAQERLDWFIEKYEPDLLIDLLGYPLYRAFMDGLTGAPVDQKWTDLLQGVQYTDQAGRLTKWRGIVSQPLDLINAIDASNTITVIVGGSGDCDPVAESNSTAIPAALVGKDFIFEQRGFGQLRTDEYSISGNTLTFAGTKKFSSGDTYFYKAATLSLNSVTGSNKESLIANYVYWHFMKDLHTQSVVIGEVKNKSHNSMAADPTQKLVRAWNEMVRWIWEMKCYLDTNREDYPEWQERYLLKFICKFQPTNEFGI